LSLGGGMSHEPSLDVHAEQRQRRAQFEQIVADLLAEAKKRGASAAEAGVSSDAGLSVSVRMGEVETVEHTRDNGLAVTVYFGHRKGSASTSDLAPEALRETVQAACNIARFTMEDPCSGLAPAERMAREIPDLDLYHPWGLSVDTAIDLAEACEQAAIEVDPRIENSEGASLNSNAGLHLYANSHGFVGGFSSTRHSLSCSVIAQQDGAMQRDYWYTVGRAAEDLEAGESVGRTAAHRALARLGARQIPTCQVPVVFRADIAASLLRSFVNAVRGSTLHRKASFLLDHLGAAVFPEFVRIHEDPLLPRGLASSAFDTDGVATQRRDLVRDGVLQGYVLDAYSACKLGMQTTGNAGGVRNLFIESGDQDLEDLLRELGTGLLVTELMGQGVNLVTGDYSRGAAGFWVEKGEVLHPVEEVTIAGNLRNLFGGLTAVGKDVDRRGSFQTGSWMVDRMTVAGS